MKTQPLPRCPQCAAVLPPGTPDGLCPKCLMALNLQSETVCSGEGNPPQDASKSPPPAPEEIARHFPNLEILERLGRGGMGVVYKARQKSVNRLVALKILAPERSADPQFAVRFQREAEALARLNHPNIVTLYEFGRTETPPTHPASQPESPNPQTPRSAAGLYFFLMEFVDGVDLRQLLHGNRVSPREALAIVPQICDALQYAHDQGIVHRDIKPENILMDRRGRVKVADFGLAKMVEPLDDRPDPAQEDQRRPETAAPGNLTGASKVMGTPNYMSPEQVEAPGEVDHRADIYALGVVFYQMLTGELPGKPLVPPSRAGGKVSIDVRLDEVVLRALEKEPERRYQQASVLKTQVETIAATPPGSSRADEDQTEKRKAESGKAGTSQSLLTPAASGEPRFSRAAIIAAVSAVLFYAALVPGVAMLSALPWGGEKNVALVAILVLCLPVIAVVTGVWLKQTPAQSLVVRLKALAWIAWVLSVPIVGFGIFFINALLSETGPWNPAVDEAVLVPLTWLGSLLLPVSGALLLWSGRITNSPSKPTLRLHHLADICALGVVLYEMLTGEPPAR